jgi:hypothetical protein
MHGGRQTLRPNLIGRLTPLARRVSTHTASSSTAITHSASRALRHVGDARQTAGRKYLYAPLRRLDFLASVLHLLVVFRSMDLTREWRWTRKEKSPVPPMTSVAWPANSADCSSSDIATSSRCFVLSLSIQPVARGKATMLGFGMRRGCYSISKKQRSGSVLLSIMCGRSSMTAACDTSTSVAAESAHATALPTRI